MIKHFMMASLVSVASLTFVAVAQAEDFPATPMNKGPMMMGGMQIPPVNPMAPLDAVLGSPAMAPQPMMDKPMMKHHMMKRHMSKKMMMKKSMMKKSMMKKEM